MEQTERSLGSGPVDRLEAIGLKMARNALRWLEPDARAFELRQWRRRFGSKEQPTPDVTILAGALGDRSAHAILEFQRSQPAGVEVQVIGFDFDGRPQTGFVGLPGGRFPDFFSTLVRALLLCKGKKLIAAQPDLLSLGLGMLHHYHFDTPLQAMSTRAVSRPTGSGPEDPRSAHWQEKLERIADLYPDQDAAAEALARELAAFHEGAYSRAR
ncbi:MAG: hypothetical protein JXR96_01465 [Deltaproteobacteria bacterium]|nr:hypothetical protein [Deltaproteobacteria bacterium]